MYAACRGEELFEISKTAIYLIQKFRSFYRFHGHQRIFIGQKLIVKIRNGDEFSFKKLRKSETWTVTKELIESAQNIWNKIVWKISGPVTETECWKIRRNSELKGIMQRADTATTIHYLQLRRMLKERKIIESQNKLQQRQWKERRRKEKMERWSTRGLNIVWIKAGRQ